MATSTTGYGPDKGHIGEVTYFQRNGQVIARARRNMRTKKGRTPRSMARRTLWNNLQCCWRQMKPVLEDCFERPRPGTTGYSEFMSLNLSRTEVRLTKTEVEEQVRVADHFVVSHGSMPQSVEARREEGFVVSDIAVPGLPNGLDSTILQFMVALDRGQRGRFLSGDEILFLRLRQYIDINTHWPKVRVLSTRLTLNEFDHRTMRQALLLYDSTLGFDSRDGHLCAEAPDGDLMAWIHLRPQRNARPKVSSQQLVGYNPLLEKYTSEEQLQEAIHSYGPLEG